MKHIGTLLVIWSILVAPTLACTMPSTYTATVADDQLVTSIEPKIDAIFATDHSRGNQIMLQLKDVSMRFDVSSREYYILRQLHLYMNTKINESITIPSYTPGGSFAPYMYYAPETFDAAIAAGLEVVINFRASWCPRCKATSEEIIAHQAEIPDWVIVLEADYDATKELQKSLGVTMQTTFVFFDTDWQVKQKVEKLSGIDELVEELE